MASSKSININMNFKNTEATEPIKNYANEKITNCLQKYIHQDIESHLVLLVEKNRHIAEISFNADGANFKCSEESENLYASIDKLCSALGNQMRKHKEKLTSHR